MKKTVLFFLLFFSIAAALTASPRFYLLTIGEADEIYALYGHTAIRVEDTAHNIDFIVDWGVFDFNQPNFYTNFAKGRMLYTTATHPYENYLRQCYYSKKGVASREILLNEKQKERLWTLIAHNLEPQNRDYYYKFIQDNCATRPRDLLEQAVGADLVYPEHPSENQTFRDILHHYQRHHAWYNLLIDIILGSHIDKKADFREQMFIPEYLENNMSQAMVSDTVTHSLLSPPTVIIEKTPLRKTPRLLAPNFVFLLLLFILLLLDYMQKGRKLLRIFDVCFFSLIVFFGLLIMVLWGFSLHQETYGNFNILWLNPLFILPLIALRSSGKKMWLFVTAGYVLLFGIAAAAGLFPQAFPFAMYVVLLIILERCYFSWKAKTKRNSSKSEKIL